MSHRTSPQSHAKVSMIMTDGDFWYSMAAKLLAPLFFAAATNGHLHGGRRRVGRRTGPRLSAPPALRQRRIRHARRIRRTRRSGAIQALHATLGRDERQRSAIFTTAETVIEAFADPDVAACESPDLASRYGPDMHRLPPSTQAVFSTATTRSTSALPLTTSAVCGALSRRSSHR